MQMVYLLQRNTFQASRILVYKPLHFHALVAFPIFQYHQFVRITETMEKKLKEIITTPSI